MQIQLSKGANQIIQKLKTLGYHSYAVGGSVRNMILGLAVEDWDIVTSAPTSVILTLFEHTYLTGKEFGTVTIALPDGKYEVTPMRTESNYADKRHPGKVTFGASLEQDLARRDFTMNAIACDGSGFIDPFDGYSDITNKTIRAVGDAPTRFDEDALRILRAFRFASVLDFIIEKETLEAALQQARTLSAISKERIRAELQKALLANVPSVLFRLIKAGGLAHIGIPEEKSNRNYVFVALNVVPKTMLLRWWAFLLVTGADIETVCKNLQFSQSFLRDLIAIQKLFSANPPQTKKELKNQLKDGVPLPYNEIVETFLLFDTRFTEQKQLFKELKNSKEAYTKEMLAIRGGDLHAIGFRGAQIRKMLDLLLQAVIKEPGLNRYGTLLALAGQMRKLV